MSDAAPASKPAQPRSALLLRPDTMGDLVLFAPALRRLREGWPGTRLAVVIRGPYLELARLLVPGVIWIPTQIDPFASGPGNAGTELPRLIAAAREFSPELVVAACIRRSWLDTAVAAALPAARRVAFASSEEDPFFAVQARHLAGASKGAAFGETAPAASEGQDWRRNFGLVDYLLGRAVTPVEPSLSVGRDLLDGADGILHKLGLQPGGFAVCAAAGFANVRIKTWPAERYAEVVSWLQRERGIRTLLVGQDDERDPLEALAKSAEGARAEVWTGGAGDLPLLAAMLSRSAFFFGNDTGAMHLAAAVGRPVVAIFGGGTWPRFQPAAGRAIALLNPLPCFGCGWDCPFGDAPCVGAIGTGEVQRALSDILARAEPWGCEIREARNLPAPVVEFMGRTAALARQRGRAHLARELKLEEIAFLAGEKDGEISALKAETDGKDAEIASLKRADDEKDAEIASLKRATDEKDSEIVSLKRSANGKDGEIRSLKRETDGKDAEIKSLKLSADGKDAEIVALKAAADGKDAEIRSLKKAADEKDAEIAALARACEERLQLINRMDADLKRCVGETGRLQAELTKLKVDPPRNSD
jgi:ADP-heptose:LPS heptosyltransferase